ncbi:hypothetical protein [Mycolicibacterium mageritense]|uniref:Uncharacterized protein n=1 Tax=Mycolicibacterium mageritense TaxID=53462 RepID=A0AAI8XQY9_MYCME|nr:hypothetical protein [Mycolicibacterium mageritense]BDY31408.1 hypothetical protein hbim_05360 [Mycolicibacterium mageritense]
MKVRIKQSPTGYISLDGGPLQAWPKAGSVVDLPQAIAEDLITSGHAAKVVMAKVTEEVEKRPAPAADVETRPKPGRPAKRPGDGG